MGEARNIVKQYSGGAWFACLITSIVAQYCFQCENDCVDNKLLYFVRWATKTYEPGE